MTDRQTHPHWHKLLYSPHNSSSWVLKKQWLLCYYEVVWIPIVHITPHAHFHSKLMTANNILQVIIQKKLFWDIWTISLTDTAARWVPALHRRWIRPQDVAEQTLVKSRTERSSDATDMSGISWNRFRASISSTECREGLRPAWTAYILSLMIAQRGRQSKADMKSFHTPSSL